MSRPSDLLDRLHITTPCNATWEEMRGNDLVRFCEHCNLSVHNLSVMTRKEALRLVKRSEGRLCVRLIRRPDGAIGTKLAATRLHQITRRASRLAAGAFTAAISLSGSMVAAQTDSPAPNPPAIQEILATLRRRREEARLAGGVQVSLEGTVIDRYGAVAPSIKVVLRDEETETERETYTDGEGQFSFYSIVEGTYKIKVGTDGDASSVEEDLVVTAESETHLKRQIMLGGVTVTVGGGVIVTALNPLVSAASENNLEAVREQLASGADVNVVDEAIEVTALGEAVSNGNAEMAQVLIAAGADVNKKMGANGETALMRLDSDATPELVRLLVAAGANVNAKSEKGYTPLMVAASGSNTETLQALIDAGANLEARNEDGRTALMCAASSAEAENVKTLVAAGADLNKKDEEGKTALAIAEEDESEELIELLKSYGATR